MNTRNLETRIERLERVDDRQLEAHWVVLPDRASSGGQVITRLESETVDAFRERMRSELKNAHIIQVGFVKGVDGRPA